MLQIKEIKKQYVTGDLVQTALDNVNLNLRDNEFVAILGPSGSGKTTLLNIIGGLDRYDSGDLIINGISTKKYKDRDWDSYRNHTIGFVFQSYNLIPHQSLLSNVELALTISGISKAERKKRAMEALEKVGLGNQVHKKPNQMSGGQMQRVAIARALVNDPDILLADEPTGALDSETSVQVMEMLKEVAKNRLVVMVTHNPELAEEYSTRTVRLRDGKIIDDTNPYEVDSLKLTPPKHENMGKSSMSFLTALSLSLNNLGTKKARTLLTSFAGSIGIIGIALILSLSNGVNTYINDIQRSTMTSYPISIDAKSMDMSSLMEMGQNAKANEDIDHDLDGVYSNGKSLEIESTIMTSITENNLTKFKKYLDNDNNEINKYVGDNGIVYSYDTQFSVFTHDADDVLINTDGTLGSNSFAMSPDTMGGMSDVDSSMTSNMSSMGGMGEFSSMMGASGNFEELIPGKDTAISNAIKDNYQVLYGDWPSEYNEVVLVLDKNNEIATQTLYELGILPSAEYKEIRKKIEAGEEITTETKQWTYKDICNQSFYIVPACDTYIKDKNGIFNSVKDNNAELEKIIEDALELKVVGVIRPNEDNDNAYITSAIGYTKNLTDYIINYTDNSDIVKEQTKNKNINVLNGMEFSPNDDATKTSDTKIYLDSLGVSNKANLCKEIMQTAYANDQEQLAQIMALGDTELAAMLDSYLASSDDTMLLSIYDTYISTGNYDDNMSEFGVISLDAPSSINIYVDSFEDKDSIADCIKDYNATADDLDKITYTDYIALLMSSITTIINVISYVLIAFVAVSLVVSSIMIGIITYISVLERTKEIGILRAIGASKSNISQIFNAETFIIGLCSGIIGIGITLLLLIPGNVIIHAVTGLDTVNAILPLDSAGILVLLSVVLTLIGGFIPAKKAAKKDPVTALRTD